MDKQESSVNLFLPKVEDSSQIEFGKNVKIFTRENDYGQVDEEGYSEMGHTSGNSFNNYMSSYTNNNDAPNEQLSEEPKQQSKRKINTVWCDLINGTNSKRARYSFNWNQEREFQRNKYFNRMVKDEVNVFLNEILSPKKPFSVLCRMYPNNHLSIKAERLCNGNMLYSAEVQIYGRIYRGAGDSQEKAKQSVGEKALKYLVLEKLKQLGKYRNSPDKWLLQFKDIAADIVDEEENDCTNEPDNPTATPHNLDNPNVSDSYSALVNDHDNSDDSVQQEYKKKLYINIRNGEENFETFKFDENNSWGLLASFALFKLFKEWTSENFEDCRMTIPKRGKQSGKPWVVTEKNPVSLLHEIYPNHDSTVTKLRIDDLDLYKHSIVASNGITYTATGFSKKEAKKKCAIKVLKELGIRSLYKE